MRGLMRCLAVVRQSRLRNKVIWRVSPAYIYADIIPARATSSTLRAGAMLLPSACVIPSCPSASLFLGTRSLPLPFRPLTKAAVIVAVVQKFKTTNPHIIHIDSIIFKTALALFVAFTFSPFLVLLVTLLTPGRKSEAEVRARQQRLGTGPTAKKVGVIAVATSLLLWELVSPALLGTAVHQTDADVGCFGTGDPGSDDPADVSYGFGALVRSRFLPPPGPA
jgi:hypothetical protein